MFVGIPTSPSHSGEPEYFEEALESKEKQ